MPSYICLNDRKGGFPAWRQLPTESATIIVAADFDGDGAVDLFVPHRDGGHRLILWNDGKASVCVYLNTGGRKFSEAIPLSSKKAPYSIAIGNLNRDGTPDIVVGNVDTPGSVFFNDRTGRSYREIRWNHEKGAVYGVALGGVDGDGWPDISAARTDAPNGIWFNTK